MNKQKIARFFPVLIVIMVVIFLIFVFVNIGRLIFGNDNKTSDNNNNQTTITTRDDLLNTEADRSITMVVRGRIVADENFRSYQVTISPSKRQLVLYKGYLGEVLDKIELDNNETAYSELVHALDKMGYSRLKPFEEDRNDTRGVCASGTVTEFDLKKADDSLHHIWTSTCSEAKGSLSEGESKIRELLLKQIPNNSKVLSNFR